MKNMNRSLEKASPIHLADYDVSLIPPRLNALENLNMQSVLSDILLCWERVTGVLRTHLGIKEKSDYRR